MKLLWLLLALALAAGALKILVSSLEPRFVFFPDKGEGRNPSHVGIPFQPITIETKDGEQLNAWRLEPVKPRADIVYFHGNGGNLSAWLPVFAALCRLDYRVLAFDYRGYGLSTGAPTETGIYTDAEAVVRDAVAHRIPGVPLVFWGRSLGATVAASATRVAAPDGLILESGFPDKSSVIRTMPVFRLLNIFGSYRLPTAELAREFAGPILVMHGDADSIIPFSLGRELFDGLSGPSTSLRAGRKEFVTLAGADHNDFFDPEQSTYWDPVVGFIDRLSR